jgi:uncharacterized OB-fold protein
MSILNKMTWEPASAPPRVLPRPNHGSRDFWTGGAIGDLLVAQCESCRRCAFPPTSRCPDCGAATASLRASGEGTVLTYTVCHQQYHPAVPTPFVVALIDLDGLPESRMPANVVGCDPAAVHSGMHVSVRFEEHGDAFVPVFVPSRPCA